MDDRRTSRKSGPQKMVVRTEGPIHQDRTAPKGQHNRTKLARRASKPRLRAQYQTGLKIEIGSRIRNSRISGFAFGFRICVASFNFGFRCWGQFATGLLVVAYWPFRTVWSRCTGSTIFWSFNLWWPTFDRPICGGRPSVVLFLGAGLRSFNF